MKTNTYTALRVPKLALRVERTGYSMHPVKKSLLRRFFEWLERKVDR